MIKILIVIEKEDGIDFRAYSLQISSPSVDMPARAELRLIEADQEPGASNDLRRPPRTGFQSNYRYPMQSGRTLETRQIFMN